MKEVREIQEMSRKEKRERLQAALEDILKDPNQTIASASLTLHNNTLNSDALFDATADLLNVMEIVCSLQAKGHRVSSIS